MKAMYTVAEARNLLIRWGLSLILLLVLTAVGNVYFSHYLVEQREGDPDTHLDRAESLMATLDFTGALVSVENALDRVPAYPRGYKVWGDILLKQEKWHDAELAYKSCLDYGGHYPGVQNNVLWALIQQGSYDEVVLLGTKFMQQREHSRLVPRYVADACVRAERWTEAVEYLKVALSANPKDMYLLGQLRLSYSKLNMKEEEDRVLARINAVDLELENTQ